MLDAVFTHDSAWSTANNRDGSPSVGKRFNNPGNLRCLTRDNPYARGGECRTVPGNGVFQYFPDETLQQGIAAAVDVYVRLYAGLDADAMTWKWARTQNGNYYNALRACYK